MKKTQIVVLGITILPTLLCASNGTEEVVYSDTIISLQDITVRAHFASENQTPLNLTTISPEKIRLHTAAPNYLEMLQGIPGVYATATTGSYGDATLNMRGFKQENISIMLNGIPIQGLTSGSMYWSNWMGLADATYSVQIQKGLGNSMLADCAMGGAVNIVTKSSSFERKIDIGLSTTSWGTNKINFGYSSGIMMHGWSVDLNLSATKGSGYVDCTDIKTFSYMLSIGKQMGENNSLIFTAIGSPENHDQRNTELSETEVDKYGRNYSKNWGYLNGKAYSIARNHYAKPYFTLQHIMDREKFSMKNSVYLALADGGGRSTYAASGATSIINHRNNIGLIDFDAIVAENIANGASKNIMIDYLSGHTQAGAITSAEYKLTPRWTAATGLQYQYYGTWSKMEILDLLGGQYWYDYSTKSNLGIGDYVGSRYSRTTHHTSGYLQALYNTEKISANLGVSIFNGNYRRTNDATNEHSDWAHGWGASVKSGILYHLNSSNALYLNAGYNSRLPYAGVYLASSNLSITNDITNEKNLMAEGGWRANWNRGGIEVSGYVASWKNKTLTVSIAKRANEAAEKYQVKGLNAFHTGIELSGFQQVTPQLKVSFYAMTASWKWKNSGKAIIYDSFSGETLKEYEIACDGLHVGDAPQTQVGATIYYHMKKGFYTNIAYQINARMYADFEPSSRSSKDLNDAYKLPAYSVADVTIGWSGRTRNNLGVNIFATCNNIFDAKYIERGIDGATHDIESFKGYWNQARTFSFGIKVSL